jgi:hypothetical protein
MDLREISPKRIARYKDWPIESAWDEYVYLHTSFIYGIKNPRSDEAENIFYYLSEMGILEKIIQNKFWVEKLRLHSWISAQINQFMGGDLEKEMNIKTRTEKQRKILNTEYLSLVSERELFEIRFLNPPSDG